MLHLYELINETSRHVRARERGKNLKIIRWNFSLSANGTKIGIEKKDFGKKIREKEKKERGALNAWESRRGMERNK